MGEPFRGKLLRTKKGAWILKRSDEKTFQIRLSELSGTLQPLQTAHNGLEVEFEMESGQPVRIRRPSEAWVPPTVRPAAVGRDIDQPQRRPAPRGPSVQQHRHSGVREAGVVHGQAQYPREYHNPYNFVPAPPRVGVQGDLADARPPGHDRYYPDRWTGKITVKMQVATPVLMPDAANERTVSGDHKVYPVRMVGDSVYLPPTAIKGVLRSAYEAVTNSRFGVFPPRAHSDRLGYRREAQSALRLVPARIERSDETGWAVRLLFGHVGKTNVNNDGRPLGNPPLMYAAWLPRYRKYTNRNEPSTEDKAESEQALMYSGNNSLPMHGEEVYIRVQRRHHRGGFYYLVVTSIRPAQGDKGPDEYQGWVCITGRNAMQKYNERVFLAEPNAELVLLSAEEWFALSQQWYKLIRSYKEANRGVLDERRKLGSGSLPPEDRYLGHRPGQMGLSYHVWKPEYQELKNGSLCYAEIERIGTTFKVRNLYPVTISRALFEQPPWNCLDPSLRPASSIDELSPADRVFGWVAEGREHGEAVAWRGCVRIGPIMCTSPDPVQFFPEPGLPLAILGQPKPQQYRFYAALDLQGNPFPDGDAGIGYRSGQGLRGRKVYPHHADLPDGYWDDPDPRRLEVDRRYREYLRPEGKRDSQNRSILGWVKPGAEFRFDIDVENLTAVELGALLWLLSLPEGCYHRLGGGKPLGFGSVRLDILDSDLRTGTDWRAYYLSFNQEHKQNDQQLIRQKCIEAFQEAVATQYHSSFEKVSFIEAILKAARGFDDKKPIHYPRVQSQRAPDPKGEGFKWFVSNKRREHGLSLAALSRDIGLPYLPERT